MERTGKPGRLYRQPTNIIFWNKILRNAWQLKITPSFAIKHGRKIVYLSFLEKSRTKDKTRTNDNDKNNLPHTLYERNAGYDCNRMQPHAHDS